MMEGFETSISLPLRHAQVFGEVGAFADDVLLRPGLILPGMKWQLSARLVVQARVLSALLAFDKAL